MRELDRTIVEGARKGQRQAQEALVRRYVAPLHALARRVVPGQDPDDLTQDLLRHVLEALPRFDPAGPATLTSWIFTVAQRHLIDVCRKRRLAEVPLEHALEVEDEAPSVERVAGDRQEVRRLEAAIATLPEAQRRVFVLAAVHGRPLEEIAQAEGVAVGTIKSRLHRARAELLATLGKGDRGDRA